mgnify:CR=1 FL=1
MTENPAVPESVRVHRIPERGHYDRETIDAILDSTIVCHVATIDADDERGNRDERPVGRAVPGRGTVAGERRERIDGAQRPLNRLCRGIRGIPGAQERHGPAHHGRAEGGAGHRPVAIRGPGGR